MAVSRQKADEDPLTMFMNNPDLVNERTPEPTVEEIKPVPKSKPTPALAPVSVPSAAPVTSPFASSSAPAAPQKVTPAVSAPPPIEEQEDIFGVAPESEAGDDLFKGVDVNKQGKGSHLLRLGNEKIDDDRLDDLKVNKLLEEENDLDYAMFGTSDVTMNGYTRASKVSATPRNDALLDDIDLDNSIIDLDIKEPDTSIFTAAMQYNTTAAAPEAASGDFDINAYIKSQTEDSGGGLFD